MILRGDGGRDEYDRDGDVRMSFLLESLNVPETERVGGPFFAMLDLKWCWRP